MIYRAKAICSRFAEPTRAMADSLPQVRSPYLWAKIASGVWLVWRPRARCPHGGHALTAPTRMPISTGFCRQISTARSKWRITSPASQRRTLNRRFE